jgi:hypothetical protein
VKIQQIQQLFIQFINCALSISQKALGTLPEDGNVMPKHVGAAIHKKLNEKLLDLLVFHAYIKEMHGSRSKIPGKNLIRLRCAVGFNSDIKRLMKNQLRFC